MFKIRKKSKSAAKSIQKASNSENQIIPKQANRYQCLHEISHTEQYWKKLLSNQMELESLIVAFQNVEISMRVDAQRKLMLRETFLLKKQIIRLIINQNFQQAVNKLEILRNSSITDYGLATLFIDFCHIRKEIIEKKIEYNIQTVKNIKEKIRKCSDKIQKEKSSIVYGRIIYVLALHLIKLNGVLLKIQDINIVVQALNLKKKELCMLLQEINQPTLESLLYLTFEFYRILYLLKRDQDLINQYYNQIRAYISIFKAKCKGYDNFQANFKIQQKIQKMKPLNLNLKIYADHQRRKILSLQNTRLDLMKNHYATRNQNILSTQITAQITNRKVKRLIRQNSIESDHDKMQMSEANINEKSTALVKEIISMVTDNKNKQIAHEDINRFNFQFIKPDGSTIIIGKFQVKLNKQFDSFKVSIKLFKQEQVLAIFTLNEIQLQKTKNFGQYAKRLWREIKQKFYTDKTQFLPNLFSFQYPPQCDLPKQINISYELPISIRIHQIILHFLRKQTKQKKMNGYIIKLPNTKLSQSKQPKKIQVEQKIFAKRTGFISFNKGRKNLRLQKEHNSLSYAHSTLSQQGQHELSLTIVTKQEQKILIMHIKFNNWVFKSCTTITKQDTEINIRQQMTYKFKDIMKLKLPKWRVWHKKKINRLIDSIQFHQMEASDFFNMPESTAFMENKYNSKAIQQEFEVMKSPVLQAKADMIKTYRQNHYGFVGKLHKYRQCFKISNLHLWFYQQVHPHFTRYFDYKREFIICQANKQCSMEYKKFRLYKTVVFRSIHQQNQYVRIACFQTKREGASQDLIIKKHKVRISWKKTKIFKFNNTFFFLSLFEHKKDNLIIVNLFDIKNSISYMGIGAENFADQVKFRFNQKQLVLNESVRMKKIQSARNSLCDAEQFLKNIQFSQGLQKQNEHQQGKIEY